jgi:membrane protease YdiL (CAAX protease family)
MPAEKRRIIRNLTVFSLIVLGVGFVGHALNVHLGVHGEESPGILLWLVGPTVVALLLRAFAGDGWADFGIRPRFRGNGRWYAASLGLYPLLTLAVLMVGAAMGLISFPGFTRASLGTIGAVFLAGAFPQFIKNIFEETAWRGYLAPRLHALGIHDFAGHVLVGLIWGAWHIPYYLYYLDTQVLAQFSTLPLWGFILQAIVVMVAWAIVYGEIYLLTKSIWPAVLMHMVEDAFLNQLLMDGHVAIVPGTDWLVSPVNGVVGISLWLAVGVGLNRYRRRREAAEAR